MADYNSMKVPELKKLLTERSLPHTGNKADLIARLTENDKLKAADSAEPQAGKPPSSLFPTAPATDRICCLSPLSRTIPSLDDPALLWAGATRFGRCALPFPSGNRLPRVNLQLNPSTDTPDTTSREATRCRGRD